MKEGKLGDQTEELNRARLEFLKRNKKEFQECIDLLEKNNERAQQMADHIASFFGGDQSLSKAWEFLFQNVYISDDLRKKEKEIETLPAAKKVWHMERFAVDHAYKAMMTGGKSVFQMSKDELNEKTLDYLTENAREVFADLTAGEPNKHLLMGIDLSRSKEVILAEVGRLIDQHKKIEKTVLGKIRQRRLKWLPKTPELLEVWDLWEEAGKTPAIQTFKYISKKVGRPLSKIKSQWYLAFEKIHGKKYDGKERYATEEKRKAADEMCVQCGKITECYKKRGESMEFIPCKAYLRAKGIEPGGNDIEYIEGYEYGL